MMYATHELTAAVASLLFLTLAETAHPTLPYSVWTTRTLSLAAPLAQVRVRLVPRNAGGKEDSWLYYLQKGSMFTHHQKSVVLDAEQLPGRGTGTRRLVAYIGGLDLCDGR